MRSGVYPPSAQAEIAAPIQTVWNMLLDGTSYPAWNSFIVSAKGNMRQVGERIDLHVRLGRHVVRPAFTTTELSPPDDGARAHWLHRYAAWPARWGLICSERRHELMATGPSTCIYATHEIFWGALCQFVPFAKIDAGFKQQARDLTTACETAASGCE